MPGADDTVENDGALISRPVPCGPCRGRGTVPAVACGGCRFIERMGGDRAALYLAADLEGAESFPCGHNRHALTEERLTAACPDCGGSGAATVWKTESQWARLDARKAREEKQARSLAAQTLKEAGPLWGQPKAAWRQMIRFLTPRCERRSLHTGEPCARSVILGRTRCHFHGGRSTGPTTEAGKQAIREANRRRSGVGDGPPT